MFSEEMVMHDSEEAEEQFTDVQAGTAAPSLVPLMLTLFSSLPLLPAAETWPPNPKPRSLPCPPHTHHQRHTDNNLHTHAVPAVLRQACWNAW